MGATRAAAEQSPHDGPEHLRVLARAAQAASAAATVEDAAAVVLADVCALFGWPVGHLYVATGPDLLVPTAAWHLADPERFRVLRQVLHAAPVAAGSGPAGRALATGEPAWSDQVPEAAADAGLGAALAIPVRGGDDVLAVLHLLGEPPHPPPAVLDAATAAAQQLGRVVDRRRAAAAEEDRRLLLETANDAFFRLDTLGVILDWNRQAEATFGWAREEALGRRLADLVVPLRHRVTHTDAVRGILDGFAEGVTRFELTALHRSGREFPVEVTAWASHREPSTVVSGFVRDVSERRHFEGQLVRQGLHDRLTGLPNRVLLRDRLEHALARTGRGRATIALLLLDLDRFKVVNDSVGHDGGDRLLVAVADRLAELARPGDTVARMGGDEYALLCEDVGGADEAAGLARRVLEAFDAPFTVVGADVGVTASLGVALAGGGAGDADLLLRDADVAMYRAKQRGRGRFEVFAESMRVEAAERLSVENDLRRAIRQGQLRLFYQPIVHLDTGRIAGFEALVRWQHPVRGLLSPAEFIPPAEETGLIVPLGRCVLGEACLQAAGWQRRRGPGDPLRVSVNVSAKQLSQPGWVEEVGDILAESGLEARQLVLEITESVLMEDAAASADRLGELRRLGVSIAIDDFGTGYSSLGYLRRLPVDILKIDKSFIDGVAEGPHESALARAVVKLAATVGLEAVAEGIGDRRQLAQLRRLRCPYGQGYYFSPPVPAEEAAALLDLPRLPAGEERGGDG